MRGSGPPPSDMVRVYRSGVMVSSDDMDRVTLFRALRVGLRTAAAVVSAAVGLSSVSEGRMAVTMVALQTGPSQLQSLCESGVPGSQLTQP